MAVTDRELARAQWRAQVVVIRRNQRRLLRALIQAYEAGFILWQGQAVFAIPARNQEAIAAAMARMWREAGTVGGRFAMESEAKADEITLFERIMQEFIRQFGADRVTQVLRTTQTQLQAIITRSIKEGLGQEALAKLISEQVRSIARVRARVIARTETHTAAMHASQEVAKTSPFPMQKRWISVYDHRTRDFGEGDGIADQANHRVMNEVTMQPGEAFAVPNSKGGVDWMQGPGDPSAPAYQVINCRCALVYRRVGRAWPKSTDT